MTLLSFEQEQVWKRTVKPGNSFSHLLYQGDKKLFWSDDRTSCLMYADNAGRFIVLGDPIGTKPDVLLKQFTDFARAEKRGCLFYQLSGMYADYLQSHGWKKVKTGEEAFVQLPDFHTNGKAWLKQRTKLNKLHREGFRCEIAMPPHGKQLMKEVADVSAVWLGARKEKAFSVGRFSREAIAGMPIVLFRSPQGELLAFVTLAEYEDDEGAAHLTIDLMRYRPNSPPGTMEAVFVHAFAWGRDCGYSTCSLGVAPLANVEPRWWMKPAAAVASRQYNFQGLYHFKAKFHPHWEERFIAYSGCPLPFALALICMLVHRRTM